MAKTVSVISGVPDGLSGSPGATIVPWVIIASVVGFVFWSTTCQIKGS